VWASPAARDGLKFLLCRQRGTGRCAQPESFGGQKSNCDRRYRMIVSSSFFAFIPLITPERSLS
jgi:hypothetical protein